MRRTRDQYFTPEYATTGLLARAPRLRMLSLRTLRGRVLECCSGAHHITNILTGAGLSVVTNDLDPAFQADFHLDMRRPTSWTTIINAVGPIDWCVSNPPFECALEIVTAARLFVPNLAWLLRISFMEPTESGTPEKVIKTTGRRMPATAPRAPFLEADPPNGVIYCPRISFSGDGHTDSATVAWHLWTADPIPRPIDVIRQPRRVAA
jgi:hypothetical protein